MAALAVVACSGGEDDLGQSLPTLELSPLGGDGGPLALGQVRGPAVINLWATWCAPCRRELPAFQLVSDQRDDVAFIGVDIADDATAAQAFLADLGVTFPQYADPDGALPDAIGAASLPVTLVVDGDGRVATIHVGPMSAAELEAAIDDVN